jgi:hypothetical protein
MLANARRTYMLGNFTVEARPKGYFFAKTQYGGDKHDWRGPYSSMSSVTLMIARELKRELTKRDASYTTED